MILSTGGKANGPNAGVTEDQNHGQNPNSPNSNQGGTESLIDPAGIPGIPQQESTPNNYSGIITTTGGENGQQDPSDLAKPDDNNQNNAPGHNPTSGDANNTSNGPTDESSKDTPSPGSNNVGFMDVDHSDAAASGAGSGPPKCTFGVQFNRTGPSADVSLAPQDLKSLCRIICKIDSTATCLGHAKTDSKKFARLANEPNVNCASLWNTIAVDWGSPADDQAKVMFSFYISSNTIPNLKALREDGDFDRYLKSGNLRVSPHDLLETESSNVGFFIGKAPTHTWKQDLSDRFSAHIKAVANLEVTSQVKTTRVTADGVSAQACSLFVGKRDLLAVQHVLEQHPFQDCEMAMHDWRRNRNPTLKTAHSNAVTIHNIMSGPAKSRAVKLIGAVPAFVDSLRNATPAAEEVKDKVIDIARVAHTHRTGTVYLNCLQENKDTVSAWLTGHMSHHWTEPTSPPKIAEAFDRSGSVAEGTINSAAAETTATNITFKNQHLLGTCAPTAPPAPAPCIARTVPAAIVTDKKSFAEALQSGASARASPITTASGFNSTTGSQKSSRELELEQENAALQQQANVQSSQMQELQHQMQNMNQQMEYLLQHIMGRVEPLRKKIDTKPTPNKTSPSQAQDDLDTGATVHSQQSPMRQVLPPQNLFHGVPQGMPPHAPPPYQGPMSHQGYSPWASQYQAPYQGYHFSANLHPNHPNWAPPGQPHLEGPPPTFGPPQTHQAPPQQMQPPAHVPPQQPAQMETEVDLAEPVADSQAPPPGSYETPSSTPSKGGPPPQC